MSVVLVGVKSLAVLATRCIATIVNPIGNLLSRYFITLDPVLSTSYTLSTPWVVTGDFEVEMEISTSATSVKAIFGGASGASYIRINADQTVSIRINNGSLTTALPVPNINDAGLSILKYRRIGTKGELLLNEFTIEEFPVVNSGTFTVDFFGVQNGVNSFDGILANVKLTDLDTPTNSESYLLGNPVDNIEYPLENVFGSELAPDYTDLDNWTASDVTEAVSGGDVIFTAIDGASDRGELNVSGLTVGETYLIEIDAEPIIGTNQAFNQWTFASINYTVINAPGKYTFIVVATAISGLLRVYPSVAGNTGDSVVVRGVSIKQVTNTLTYNNISIDDREQFTLVDSDWFGVNSTVNGGFDTDSDWEKSVGWSISGGTALYDGNVDGRYIKQFAGFVEGFNYEISYDILSISGGSIEFYDGLVYGNAHSLEGKVSFKLPYLGSNPSLHLKKNGASTTVIDNVSVKRIIEVSPQFIPILARTFITLDPVQTAHYSLSTPWVAAGDFELEADFSLNGTPTSEPLFGIGLILVRVVSDTSIIVWGDTAEVSATFTVPSLGSKLNHIKLEMSANHANITLTLNGSLIGTSTTVVSNFAGDSYFGRRATNYFDGIIANVKLTDIDTPANSLTFALGEETANYELPVNGVIGSEEWVNGEITLVDGGTSSLLNLGGQTTVLVSLPENVQVTQNGSWLGLNETELLITTQFVTFRNFSDGGGDITFTPSIKEVTNALTYNNISTDDREQFNLVANDWVGEELVVNGGFDTDSGWSKGSGCTITQGSGTCDGNISSFATAFGQSILGIGINYKTTYEVVDYTSGDLQLKLGSAGAPVASGLGVYNYIGLSAGDISLRMSAGAIPANLSIDNVSVKRIIEEA